MISFLLSFSKHSKSKIFVQHSKVSNVSKDFLCSVDIKRNLLYICCTGNVILK